MMCRAKTEIELTENHAGEATRLREALFLISLEADPEEMRRIAHCAMTGKLHGKEILNHKETEL